MQTIDQTLMRLPFTAGVIQIELKPCPLKVCDILIPGAWFLV